MMRRKGKETTHRPCKMSRTLTKDSRPAASIMLLDRLEAEHEDWSETICNHNSNSSGKITVNATTSQVRGWE
jgi:hypothetical protein